jgi:7-cyano-7-deazaguanine synthase
MKSALVVLSGGQDSTTCLFWAKEEFDVVHAVTFDYGQRHARELDAARKVADLAGVASHEVVTLGPILAGASPLTNASKELERYESFEQMDKVIGDRVELTFVPMRNALFLTLAANRAAVLGVRNIVVGVCEQDNANYPDCRRVFIDGMKDAINFALGMPLVSGVTIHTPLIDLSKAASIRLAKTLPGCMEALAFSHTSYAGEYPPVDRNHANVLRAQGFLEAGEPDPLVVRAWREGLMALPGTPNYDKVLARA